MRAAKYSLDYPRQGGAHPAHLIVLNLQYHVCIQWKSMPSPGAWPATATSSTSRPCSVAAHRLSGPHIWKAWARICRRAFDGRPCSDLIGCMNWMIFRRHCVVWQLEPELIGFCLNNSACVVLEYTPQARCCRGNFPARAQHRERYTLWSSFSCGISPLSQSTIDSFRVQ